MRAAVLRIPKGKGEGEVEPPLGGISAAAGDGAGTDDAEAHGDETVDPFAWFWVATCQPRPTWRSCDVPSDDAPRALVANADPSACRAGLA